MSRKKAPSRLLTDAVREVRNTRSRFLSLLVLSALAVCFLAGLRATAPDMKETGDLYFDQQRLMDLRVVSTLGLTEEDVELLARQGILCERKSVYSDIDALNALGYDCGSVDGIFGSKTKAAVMAFQKANGLGADGIVGPLTWGKLV